MTAGGPRPGSGRPKLEPDQKKINPVLSVRIAPELMQKIKNQELPVSQIVEAALRQYFGSNQNVTQ